MSEDFFNLEKDQKTGRVNPVLLYGGIALIVLILVVVVIWILIPAVSTLSFSVEFSDAGLLTKGAPVTLRGVEIGRVKDVEVGSSGAAQVKVSVKNKYTGLLHEGSVFRLQTDATGAAYIQAEVLDANSPLISSKSSYTGASNYLEYLEQSASIKGKEYLRNLAIGILDVSTTLRGNTIQQDLILVTGEWIPVEVLFAGIIPENIEWDREVSTTDGYNLMRMNGRFEDPSIAAWAYSEIQQTRTKNLLFTDVTFSQVFPKDSFQTNVTKEMEGIELPDLAEIGTKLVLCLLDPSHVTCGSLLENVSDIPDLLKSLIKALGDQISEVSALPLEKVEVNVRLNLPGKILSHNGFEKEGRDIIWHLTGKDLNDGYTLNATYRVWNTWLVVVIAGVLILGVGGAIFWISRRGPLRSSDERQDVDAFFD